LNIKAFSIKDIKKMINNYFKTILSEQVKDACKFNGISNKEYFNEKKLWKSNRQEIHN